MSCEYSMNCFPKHSFNTNLCKKPGRFSTPSGSIKLDKLNYNRRILISGFVFSFLVHLSLAVVFFESPFSRKEELSKTGQEVGIIYLKKISPRPSMSFEYKVKGHSLKNRRIAIMKESKSDSASFG